MKKGYTLDPQDEPIGIVISRGDHTEPTPMFVAYFWGPAPEPADKASKAA